MSFFDRPSLVRQRALLLLYIPTLVIMNELIFWGVKTSTPFSWLWVGPLLAQFLNYILLFLSLLGLGSVLLALGLPILLLLGAVRIFVQGKTAVPIAWQRKATRLLEEIFELFSEHHFMLWSIIIAVILGLSGYLNQPLTSTSWLVARSIIAIPSLLILGTVAAYKLQLLSQDSAVIAKDMGGTLVPLQPKQLSEQRLQNIVEEIAIASGLPVPRIYLLPNEAGINAFAAGHSHENATLAFSEGCVGELTRDQLQAIVAHLFSSLLYGETRFNLQLYALSHGILFIYNSGRRILADVLSLADSSDNPTNSRNKRSFQDKVKLYSERLFLFFLFMGPLTLILAGMIGLVGDRLIKGMLSRQQTYVADAASIQLTRHPQALMSSLQHIEQSQQGSYLRTLQAEVGSHLFFSQTTLPHILNNSTQDINDLLLSGFSSLPLLIVHPPLKERIRRLQARFSIHPTVHSSVSAQSPTPHKPSSQTTKTKSSFSVEQIVTLVGTVELQHLNYARSLLANLSPRLQAALKSRRGSTILVYGLLLEVDPVRRQEQLQSLAKSEPANFIEIFTSLVPDLTPHLPHARLSLLELAIPALRQLSRSDLDHFMDQVSKLIHIDNHLSLTEYVIQLLLAHRLEVEAVASSQSSPSIQSIKLLWQDCVIVLSTLAAVDHEKPVFNLEALQAGLAQLSGTESLPLPKSALFYSFDRFGVSLKCLKQASPPIKQRIVDACGHVVLKDGIVSIQEAELFRGIVITLGCPLPPFLQECTSQASPVVAQTDERHALSSGEA